MSSANRVVRPPSAEVARRFQSWAKSSEEEDDDLDSVSWGRNGVGQALLPKRFRYEVADEEHEASSSGKVPEQEEPDTNSVNAEDDDEDDYMSESFTASVADVRPGLALSRTERRILKIEAEKYENAERLRKIPSRAEMEKELRETGLSKPVSEESKGFALLAKMGYKPGMSLGKKKEGEEEGIKEPITIDFKTCRTGLGHKTEEEAKQKRRADLYVKASLARAKVNNLLLGDFQKRKRTATVQKQINGDLMKSRKACQELDLRKGLLLPTVPYFWPIYKEKADEMDEHPKRRQLRGESVDTENFFYSNGKQAPAELQIDELAEDEIMDRLEDITVYLRGTHYYCIWCGCQYESEQDLRDQCPGSTRDSHEGDDDE